MGETFFGSEPKQTGQANLLTPDQQKFLSSILRSNQGAANNAFSGFLGEFDPQQLTDFYQKGLVDPTMQTYTEQVLPAIQQRFVDSNAGSSSALNQALAKSASDVSSGLSGQLSGLLYQGRQQADSNKMAALNQILSLLGQRTFDPIVQGPQSGLLSDLIQGGTKIGAAALGGGSF